ncbi:MAG: carboxypeptidase regulatory-like domain-containing protein, partial [Acidobacteriota bacterium]
GVRLDVMKEVLLDEMRSFRNIGQGESGEDGAFRVEGLGSGGHVLRAFAAGFKPARLEVEVAESEPPRPLTVILRRGAGIAGRVEEATGAPAAGVNVDVGPAAAEQGSRMGMGMRVDVRTDPEGRFSVEGLDPGRYLLSVGDEAGFGASEIVEAGANEEVVLRLRAPGSLLCRVVDSAGAPVAGAEVMAMPAQTVAGGVQRRTTGPDGAASFEGLAAERHRLQVSADGLPPAMQVVTVGSGRTTDITVTLERGGTLVGRVLGLTAEQRARVSVAVRGNRARVSQDGSFTITGVRIGVGQVSAWLLPEGTERNATFEIADAQTPASVEIDFGGGATLVGSVTRGGRAAAGLRVAAVAGRGRATSTVTGEDGAYRLEGIEEGDVVVTVNSDTGATLATRRLTANGETRADFDVPAGEVVGRVIDAATREGVAQASLAARAEASPPVERAATGGEDGTFRIGELADGDYLVRASASGFAPAEARVHVAFGRAAEVTLALEGEQRLDVTVVEPDGTPCDSFLLVPAASGVVLDSVWARCDRRGRAVVASLGPGSYTALLVGRGAALARLSVPSSGGRVVLRPLGTLVVLAPPPGASAWRVRALLDGIAVPVQRWSNPERGEWVSLVTRTLSMRLPEGEVVVQAVDPGGATHERRVRIPPGGEAIARFGD